MLLYHKDIKWILSERANPGLEKYLNSTFPIGQVTPKFCLPGTLPRLPKFSNSLIIHDPRMEVKLQACFIKCNKAILTVVLLVLITFMFKSLCCNTSTTFNFFILLFMEIFVSNKYKGSTAIEADTFTRCFYGVKFNFPWNFRMWQKNGELNFVPQHLLPVLAS